jgi:hypothetical protein
MIFQPARAYGFNHGEIEDLVDRAPSHPMNPHPMNPYLMNPYPMNP